MDDSFDRWLDEREAESEPGPDEFLPGTVVGTCVIEALLGHGGFADVYRAKDEDGSPVAVKILHRLDEKSRKRFRLESKILGQIRHPNFPRFLGADSCGDRPYFVMELLHAYELPKTDRAVAQFLLKIIAAIDALHDIGFVHRDIKPSNILARYDGEPVIVDFGLAAPISRQQRAEAGLSVDEEGKGVAVGTAGYSAPEQFSGQYAGREADVHAIGVLINDCFGGKLPTCWKRIYFKATNSKPEMRYQTVEALRKAILWRHGQRVLLGAVVLLVLTLLAFWSRSMMLSYAIENTTPRKFQESGL